MNDEVFHHVNIGSPTPFFLPENLCMITPLRTLDLKPLERREASYECMKRTYYPRHDSTSYSMFRNRTLGSEYEIFEIFVSVDDILPMDLLKILFRVYFFEYKSFSCSDYLVNASGSSEYFSLYRFLASIIRFF